MFPIDSYGPIPAAEDVMLEASSKKTRTRKQDHRHKYQIRLYDITYNSNGEERLEMTFVYSFMAKSMKQAKKMAKEIVKRDFSQAYTYIVMKA